LQQEIQNLNENSIDPEKGKFYQNKIAEWEKMDESLKNEIDYLKIEVHDNKETLEALKETVEDNKNCCSENSRNIQVLEQKHQKHFEHAEHFEQKLQTIEETITTISLQSRGEKKKTEMHVDRNL
jgi:chromosome segregation ATPase